MSGGLLCELCGLSPNGIRDWYYVKVLNVEGKKGFIAKNELDRKFPPINWKMCLSETVANFYDVPYKGHDGCCGAKKRRRKN